MDAPTQSTYPVFIISQIINKTRQAFTIVDTIGKTKEEIRAKSTKKLNYSIVLSKDGKNFTTLTSSNGKDKLELDISNKKTDNYFKTRVSFASVSGIKSKPTNTFLTQAGQRIDITLTIDKLGAILAQDLKITNPESTYQLVFNKNRSEKINHSKLDWEQIGTISYPEQIVRLNFVKSIKDRTSVLTLYLTSQNINKPGVKEYIKTILTAFEKKYPNVAISGRIFQYAKGNKYTYTGDYSF